METPSPTLRLQRIADADLRSWVETILETSPDAMVILDVDKCVTAWNPAATTLFGYEANETIGRNIEFLVPKSRAFEMARLEGLLKGQTAPPFESLRLTRDDNEIDVMISHCLLLDHNGQASGALLTFRDISHEVAARRLIQHFNSDLEQRIQERTKELIETSRSLQAARRRYARLFHRAPVAILMLDSGGTVIECNRGAVKLFEGVESPLVGERFKRILTELGAQREEFEALLEDDSKRITLSIKSPSGQSWIELQASPIEFEGGLQHQVFCRDVTTERVAEELRAATQAQRLDAIGQLAGSIAHDFNNLLSTILSLTQVVRKSLPPGSRAAGDIDEIEAAGQKAAELTGRLSSMSRTRTQSVDSVDLNAIVKATAEQVQPLVQGRIVLDLDSNLPPVRMNRSEGEHLASALLMNAAEALDEAGANINVKTGRQPNANGGWITLEVMDSGRGMTPEVKERIFDPFFTTKDGSRPGRGLGLTSVRLSLERASGEIDVKSEQGQGTTVLVRVQPAQPSKAETWTDIPTNELSAGSGTILVVDDEPALRRLSRRILEEAGYAVLTAQSGPDALGMLHSSSAPVSLILSDVLMQGMSGLELAHEVRRENPSLPIVFMSGYSEDDELLEQPSQIIGKPFTPKTLLAGVRSALVNRPEPASEQLPPDANRILIVDDEEPLVRALTRILGGDFDVLSAHDVQGAIELLVAHEDIGMVFCDLNLATESGLEVVEWIRANRPALKATSFLLTGDRIQLDDVRVLRKPLSPDEVLNVAKMSLSESAPAAAIKR